MATANAERELLAALNASAAFNRWAGFELGAVAPGAVELQAADLFACQGGVERLVATGETILIPIGSPT